MFKNKGRVQAGTRINMSSMAAIENSASGTLHAREGIDLLGLTLDAKTPSSPRTRRFLESKGAVLTFSSDGVDLSGDFTLTKQEVTEFLARKSEQPSVKTSTTTTAVVPQQSMVASQEKPHTFGGLKRGFLL